eukprot:scaffold8365_cov267-Pinguiococcus_pyrenoidosus.AAC.5
MEERRADFYGRRRRSRKPLQWREQPPKQKRRKSLGIRQLWPSWGSDTPTPLCPHIHRPSPGTEADGGDQEYLRHADGDATASGALPMPSKCRVGAVLRRVLYGAIGQYLPHAVINNPREGAAYGFNLPRGELLELCDLSSLAFSSLCNPERGLAS